MTPQKQEKYIMLGIVIGLSSMFFLSNLAENTLPH